MDFTTKLKDLRRQSGLSQEQLANRVGVSRQAISKWESGAGRPELENLVALSDVFAVSVDALLGIAIDQAGGAGEYRYESVTNYDIGQAKHFDIDCGSLYACTVRGYDGEQLRVRVVSNTVATLARHFKVSIDDRPKRLDVVVNRGPGISETLAKDDVSVVLSVPLRYVTTMECAAKAYEVEVHGLDCAGVELDVRTQRLTLDDVHAHVEVNCNLDMDSMPVARRPRRRQPAVRDLAHHGAEGPSARRAHTRAAHAHDRGRGRACGRGFAQRRRAQRRGERADHRGEMKRKRLLVHVTTRRYHEDPWQEDNMAMFRNTSPSTFSSPEASYPPSARA